MNDVLKIEDLEVTFATDHGNVKAVDGVSLAVQPGRVLAVVGESGSGKTVSARTVLGLLPETAVARGSILLAPRAGELRTTCFTHSADELRAVRGRDVAMVFQEPSTALNPVYTIGWQIGEGLRAHGKYTKKELRARAVEMLELVGLPDPAERVDYYPHQLSGGQKQRVMIAMALALKPGLIVADEPTTALDVTVQAEILDLLRSLRDELGTAILLITHNMGVVADLADDVAVMYQGKVVEQASVAEVFANPREDYTKRLLGAVLKLGDGRLQPRDRSQEPDAVAHATVDRAGAPIVSARGLEIQYLVASGSPASRQCAVSTSTFGPARSSGSWGSPDRGNRQSAVRSPGSPTRPVAHSPSLATKWSASRSGRLSPCASRSGSCSRIRGRVSTRC